MEFSDGPKEEVRRPFSARTATDSAPCPAAAETQAMPPSLRTRRGAAIPAIRHPRARAVEQRLADPARGRAPLLWGRGLGRRKLRCEGSHTIVAL